MNNKKHRILTHEEVIERDRKNFEECINEDIEDVLCCFEYSLDKLSDLLCAIEQNRAGFKTKDIENLNLMKRLCVEMNFLKEHYIYKIKKVEIEKD